MRTAIAAIATLVAMAGPGNGEPAISPPEPVVAIDDVRSHAPILQENYQLGATYRYLFHGGENRDLATVQAALGPIAFEEPHLRTLLSWIRHNSVRVRATAVGVLDDRQVGPLTFAFRHYVVVDALDIAPLLHVHLGVETAVSTPWLSSRLAVPGDAIRTAMAVDTELASNGWSLRPMSVYVRADLLLCRSIYLEAGVAPEAFVPTLAGAQTEIGMRFHAGFGASFACVHDRDSWTKNLGAVVEYRGRTRLYSGDAGPDLFGNISLELQHRGEVTFGTFISTDLGSFVGVGGRFQLGGR